MRQSLATIAGLLVPFASAMCRNIDLVDAAGQDTIAPINIGLDPSEGPQSDDQVFRVTEIITCISGNSSFAASPSGDQAPEDAEDVGSEDDDDDDAEPCPIGNYTYPMVLTIKPAIRHAHVSDASNVYDLVRGKADRPRLALANFNSTVRFNYTLANDTVPAGSQSYYLWYSLYRCWEGTLRDCDDADADARDRNVTACSLLWEEGTQGLAADQQKFQGIVSWVQATGPRNASSLSWPRSADFDWDAYSEELEESQAGPAQGPDSGVVLSADVMYLKAVGWALGLAWALYFLLS